MLQQKRGKLLEAYEVESKGWKEHVDKCYLHTYTYVFINASPAELFIRL